MKLRGRLLVGVVVAVTVLGVTGVAQAASGSGSGSDRITIRDDCEPTSFNAALGPGVCVRDGGTTFEEFLEELDTLGEAPKWRFNPDETHIDQGEKLMVVNRGGEFHTFTRVQEFGPGCVPLINAALGLTADPIDECAGVEFPEDLPVVPPPFVTSGVPSGGMLMVPASNLKPGLNLFECVIHPWMRSVVEVRVDHSGHH